MSQILIENMEREVVRLQDATSAEQRAGLVASMILADFVTPERMHRLYPHAEYHMSGPVDQVFGQVVEARTRRINASWSWGVANDFVNKTSAVEFIYGEFEKCLAGIINEHALQREVVCPYVPLFANQIIVDPATLEPVMTFSTRYGVYTL